MWMDEEDAHLDEQNEKGLVHKFNSMLKDASSVYFDVDQIEVIIEHYLERAKPDQALKAVEHGLSIFPTNDFLKLRRGQVLVSLGEFNKGKKILDTLLQRDPNNAEIHFGLGMTYSQMKEPEVAIGYFKRAYDLADKELQAEILVELALQYQFTQQGTKSLACYKKGLELALNTDVVLRELKSFNFRFNMLVEVEEIIQNYLDQNPYDHTAWFYLGMIQFESGLTEPSISSYDFALAIKEEQPAVYYKKAEALIKLNRHKEALESLHAELKYREPIALNYCIIADCYENLNDFRLAEEYYHKALELDSSFSEAYIGLGFLKEVNGDYLSALPYYAKAVKVDEDNYNAHLMLSSVLCELGKIDEAREVVLNLLVLEDGLEEAWIELAYLYLKEENLEKALQIIDEGIETAYSNEQLWLKKVVYLHKFGKHSEALELARELLVEDVSVKPTLMEVGPGLMNDPAFVQLLSEF